MNADTHPDKLSIVVYSGKFDEVHYALVMASAAAAVGRPVTLFFTMDACIALEKPRPGEDPAWTRMPVNQGSGTAAERDAEYSARGIATFDELIEACTTLGVKFMVCEMGLRAGTLEDLPLRDDVAIEERGVVTFLNDASKDGTVIFL